ncbi:hypothetical protein ACFQVC_42185 [Streptomyces monticola]|uniref:Uncharacterized protein n=1 Tax=Streptomyces monticola TaxID=2666263 RepID=A0ABW2JXH6_9ACTN
MAETVNLAQFGQRAGVGRAAVVNWRRRHPDFPVQVGGSAEHPEFDTDAADQWLRDHGKNRHGLTTVSCRCGEQPVTPQSPLSRADDAKRRRDLMGEIDALVGGHSELTEAPWYPAQPGDQLLVTMEATETQPRFTELYEVTDDGQELRVVAVDGAPEGMTGGRGRGCGGCPRQVRAEPRPVPQ